MNSEVFITVKSNEQIFEEAMEKLSRLSDRDLLKLLKESRRPSINQTILHACLERLMLDMAVRSEQEDY